MTHYNQHPSPESVVEYSEESRRTFELLANASPAQYPHIQSHLIGDGISVLVSKEASEPEDELNLTVIDEMHVAYSNTLFLRVTDTTAQVHIYGTHGALRVPTSYLHEIAHAVSVTPKADRSQTINWNALTNASLRAKAHEDVDLDAIREFITDAKQQLRPNYVKRIFWSGT